MDRRRLRRRTPDDVQFENKLAEALKSARTQRVRDQLAVAHAFFIEKKSHREVHEATGMPVHRIKNLLRRVRVGGVEAIRGGRGLFLSGRNKNFQLDPVEEGALILRYRTGNWGTAAETREFLIALRSSVGVDVPAPSLSAIREYKKKFSKEVQQRRENRNGGLIALNEGVDILLSRRNCLEWRHILRAGIMDSSRSRDALSLAVESLYFLAVRQMWDQEWISWRQDNPRSETIVERCGRMLGEASCNALLAEMPVIRFHWPEDGSPLDGEHFSSWKVLGFYQKNDTSILALARKSRTPRGGLFYRSGFFIFPRKKTMRPIPKYALIDRLNSHMELSEKTTEEQIRKRDDVVVFASDPDESDRILSSCFRGSLLWKGQSHLAAVIELLCSLKAHSNWREDSHRNLKIRC
jgi:hypothetical protein